MFPDVVWAPRMDKKRVKGSRVVSQYLLGSDSRIPHRYKKLCYIKAVKTKYNTSQSGSRLELLFSACSEKCEPLILPSQKKVKIAVLIL